jgi:hypothetical protein
MLLGVWVGRSLLMGGGGAGGVVFDAIAAEEAVVRERVEELESRVAELMVRLEAERERLSRLVSSWRGRPAVIRERRCGMRRRRRKTPHAAERASEGLLGRRPARPFQSPEKPQK